MVEKDPIAGGLFHKKFYFGEEDFMYWTEPMLQRLANKKLIPDPFLIVSDGVSDRADFYMEKIDGVTLSQLPEEVRHSNKLVSMMAHLYQDLFDEGAYHTDPHFNNFMFDAVNKRVVAVDANSFMRSDKPVETYTEDFSRLMAEVFLGYDMVNAASNIAYENQKFFPFLKDERLEEYEDVSDLIFFEYFAETAELLLKHDRIKDKVDPKVLDFVIRGLRPETSPSSFEELLSLEAA